MLGRPGTEILRLPLGSLVIGRVVLIVSATLRATMIFVATHLKSISNRNQKYFDFSGGEVKRSRT